MNKLSSHFFNSWKHHLGLQFATLLVLTASFTVISSMLTVNQNLSKLLTLWGENIQMTIYLKEDISDSVIGNLSEYLNGTGKTSKVNFVSKENALKLFQDQMASYAPDLIQDQDLLKFIPASLQVSLKQEIPVEQHAQVMSEIAESLKLSPGVDEVSYGQEWIKNYASLLAVIKNVSGIIIMIIVFGGLFVMSNSIQTSISQRREEIEILELIGSTSNSIRIPYIFEGSILGVTAATIGLFFSFAVYTGIKNIAASKLSFLQISTHISFLNTGTILLILISGILAGAFGSFLCVRRINSGWAASERQRG